MIISLVSPAYPNKRWVREMDPATRMEIVQKSIDELGPEYKVKVDDFTYTLKDDEGNYEYPEEWELHKGW